MPKGKEGKKVLVSLTSEQYKAVESEAKSQLRSVSNMVAVLLLSTLENRKDKNND